MANSIATTSNENIKINWSVPMTFPRCCAMSAKIRSATKCAAGLIAAFGLMSAANAAIEEVSLNGEWDFTLKENLPAEKPEPPPANDYDVKLAVPDYMGLQIERLKNAKWWKGQKEPQQICGTGFYRKVVAIPAAWEGRAVRLYVGRGYYRINIWLNGRHIAYYPYAAYTPFVVNLSGELKFGCENEIIVSVENENRMMRDGILGGLTSKVSLLVSRGGGWIEGVYLRPGKDLSEAIWQVDLKSIGGEWKAGASQLKWKVRDWDSKNLVGEGVVPVDGLQHDAATVTWTSHHDGLKPWSMQSPNLYVAEVSWEGRSGLVDSQIQRFGLRRWSSEGRDLKLNGAPVYLRQFMISGGFLLFLPSPPDKAFWLRLLQMAKDDGYNGVVCCVVQFPAYQELLEAADEIGLAVQSSAAKDTAAVMGDKIMRLADLWRQMALWTRGYPSMSIYEMGGEMPYYDGFIEDAEKASRLIKSINPESMFMPNQAMKGIEYNFMPEDLKELTNTPFPHHAGRLERLSAFSDILGQYPLGVFSYSPLKTPWQVVDKYLEIYRRPLISHEVVMRVPPLYIPNEDGVITSLRFGRAARVPKKYMALQDKNSETNYECMSKMSALTTKYVFEKLRKCGNNAGYEDLMVSCRHHPFGYPSSLQPAPGFENIRKINADSVILLDFDEGQCLKRCFWEGERFRASVMVSLYAPMSMKRGALSWELYDGHDVLDRGFFQTGEISNGKVTTLGAVEFNWPKVKKNCKLSLQVKLAGYDAYISNDWDFWVFKKQSAPKITAACSNGLYSSMKARHPGMRPLVSSSKENLWVVDQLDEAGIKHLEAGGDILLIGGKPFVLYTRSTSFFGFRDHHNHGSWIAKHPVFKDIPNEGWGDWQFYPLIEGAKSVIFRDQRRGGSASQAIISPSMPLMEGIPFNPLLRNLHFWNSSDQACVFELAAGKGRMFVTTCVRDDENPVCATLMDSIMDYMSTRDFKPAPQVPIDVLETLIKGDGRKTAKKPKDSKGAEKAVEEKSLSTLVVLMSKNGAIEQLGGQALTDKETVIEVVPKGKSFPLEISIDSGEFKPYAGGFTLESGLHSISCRRGDNHHPAIFTDNCLEGEVLSIQVK